LPLFLPLWIEARMQLAAAQQAAGNDPELQSETWKEART
jgi:hypothetical protein